MGKHDEPVRSKCHDGVWERTGFCCRCGECCKSGNPFTGEANEPCPLLALSANGLHACSDRENEYYLKGCVVWPTHPGQIVSYPSCTYRFTKIKNSDDSDNI